MKDCPVTRNSKSCHLPSCGTGWILADRAEGGEYQRFGTRGVTKGFSEPSQKPAKSAEAAVRNVVSEGWETGYVTNHGWDSLPSTEFTANLRGLRGWRNLRIE